jgi:hypothetical protein
MTMTKIVPGSYVDELDADPMVKRISSPLGWRTYRCCGEEITIEFIGNDQYRLSVREIPI